MNIFILDEDPSNCPEYYTNKHIVKMVLETAQLLCSAHEPGNAPYKRTHYNHPCSKWVRESTANYKWTITLGKAIATEYTSLYGRRHKSEDVIDWCAQHIPQTIPAGDLTPFAQCMPDKYKDSCAVIAYRRYYEAEKLGVNNAR